MAASLLVSACNARSLAPDSDGGSVLTPTKPGGDASAGGGARGSSGPGGSVAGGASNGQGGGGGGDAGGAGPGVGASVPVCPPIDQVGPAPVPRSFPLPSATRFPFSCRPLPSAFMFPPPGADVVGRFARCASFEVGAARSIALSPDGGLAALVTDDGLVRIVSVAEQQVIAVLASPRAMIDLVAYQPHGRAVMTLARAQHEVTLWRTSDWKPIWRVTLAGTSYYHASGGGLAFSPDGASAVVSPGASSFVLDVATGAVLALRTSPADMVSDVAYGWGGRRIVVAEPLAAAQRCHEQSGGKVTVLDAATLAPVATVADLGSDGDPGGVRGVPQFRASPTDDLVLVPPFVGDPPGPSAYRLSDGGALPPPPLVGGLPAAFLPDGATVLMGDVNGLRRVRLADGLQAATVSVTGGPMAMSADGDLIAFGGSGANLLRVANADGAPPVTICAADDPTGNAAGPGGASSPGPVAIGATSALSLDGQLLALAAHGEVRIIQRADGAVMTRFSDGLPTDLEPVRLVFSPLGKFVVTQPQARASVNSVFPVLTVGRVGAFLPDVNGWNWTGVAFSPQEDRVYSSGYRMGAPRLDAMDLPSGATSSTGLANFTVVIGSSNGCPVLYESSRGAWRSCGACADAPIGGGEQYNPFGAQGAVLSPDGQVVGTWSNAHDPGVKLWRLPPAPARMLALTRRSAWNGSEPVEYAVAISPGAEHVLTGAQPAGSCYDGPQFPIWVHDVGAGAVVDMLPPAPAAADGALRTIAYGAQLWCAR